MNRKQRVKMIVRVLLSPFTRDPFPDQDLLLNYTRACQRLWAHQGLYRDLAHGCARARRALVHSLTEEVKPDRLSELRELFEMFYPPRELAEHLDRTDGDGLEEYYFKTLLRLSTELITLRDGKVSIKTWDTPGSTEEFFPDSSGLYKVELWNEISRVITPDVLIAGYFVQCGIEDVRYLQRLPDNIFLSDPLFSRVSRRGLAETHLHLSAGMSYQAVWEAVTDPAAQRLPPKKGASTYQKRQRREQDTFHGLLIAGWLRLIMATYLEEPHSIDMDIPRFYLTASTASTVSEDSLGHRVLHFLLDNSGEESLMVLLSELAQRDDRCQTILRQQFGVDHKEKDLDVLLRGPYRHYRRLQTAPELLLLFFSLDHIRRFPQHTGFQRVLLCYLRIKNGYFSRKLQSMGMSGLTFFRKYFSEAVSSLSVRRGEDAQKRQLAYQAAFRNQLHCTDLKKLEVKLSPPLLRNENPATGRGEYRIAIANQLIELFTAYRTVLLEDRIDQDGTAHPPTLGLVYHLLRGDTHDLPADTCWVLKTPAGPGDVVSTIRRRSICFVEGLQYLLQHIPGLSEYVVGLDVASEELYAEPWVYAPVYHKARNRYSTYPVQPETGQLVQNLGFTYHVGEDYHHVVSGLRHIDEVLTHFGYKAGDRLGHGMALQVDLAEWVHNNEVVSLPTVEHLENLLWLWSLCNEDPKNLLEYLPGLEREIMELAGKLYCNVKGLTPHMLWTAYQKKFQELDSEFCAQMEQVYFQPEQDLCRASESWPYPFERSFCARTWQRNPDGLCRLPQADNIWDANKLLLTHYCPSYEHHYHKPYFAFTGPDKLPLYQAVQVHMRRKVQQMGVYIETNPTSNLLIGDIYGLREYPITDLNDHLLRERTSAAVLISVNSDDPLLFNTNIENELALVYHMLVYRGFAREQVIGWIDKVRQYGMDSSFIRTVKTRQQQLQEMEQMIDQLRQLRKELIEKGTVTWTR